MSTFTKNSTVEAFSYTYAPKKMSSRTNDEAIYPNSGSMGWFFGFKLHLICNEKGELLNFMITPGDVDDRKPLEYKAFIEFIQGKLVGDKGVISKNLFQRLYVDGIQLINPNSV